MSSKPAWATQEEPVSKKAKSILSLQAIPKQAAGQFDHKL
jgi:hypothetical protein